MMVAKITNAGSKADSFPLHSFSFVGMFDVHRSGPCPLVAAGGAPSPMRRKFLEDRLENAYTYFLLASMPSATRNMKKPRCSSRRPWRMIPVSLPSYSNAGF